MRRTFVIIVVAAMAAAALTASGAVAGLTGNQDSSPWLSEAQAEITATAAIKDNQKKPKNVILFVGDGMGVSTVTAARILEGQLNDQGGEENLLSFEEFPHLALSKVYNTDAQVPDSAGTMTAMMTGVKTNIGVVGVDENVVRGECDTVAGNELTSWMMLAEEAGMATGVVSTARITHATPAATYAVVPDRNWEDDSDIATPGCEDYPDIASQLVDWSYGDGFEVALGGGRRHFLPDDGATFGPEGDPGDRTDGRNLTTEWDQRGDEWAYVDEKSDLDAIDLDQVDHLLGLFEESHVEYEYDREQLNEDEPSLTEMTETALEIVSRERNGFALTVEAGRIDHAHHGTNAYRALTDTIELSNAIQRTTELVDMNETLIVVTADHSHVLTMAGYPPIDNPILGQAGVDSHGVPYNTLSYANGPSADYAHDHDENGALDAGDDPFYEPGEFGRFDPTEDDPTDPDYIQQALVELGSETHSGEDVAIYANGPFSHLFNGTKEQNYIGAVIMESLGFLNN